MNKRTIVASLNEIANELDSNGLFKEANEVTQVMVKISQYELSEQEIANSAIANAQSKFSDGDKRGALKELGAAGRKIRDPKVKGQLLKVYTDLQKSKAPNPPFKMPEYDLNIPMPYDNLPKSEPAKPSVGNNPAKSDDPKISDPLPSLNIPMPYDQFLGKPSAPGKPSSKKPQTAEGLDRWVNKAENIYKAWGDKGANPNSEAFELIMDIHDYMKKVKSNLPTSLQSAADAKIKKVTDMAEDIVRGRYTSTTVTPYSSMSGYPGKGADPFGGQRIQGKQLDYQARQEAKSY